MVSCPPAPMIWRGAVACGGCPGRRGVRRVRQRRVRGRIRADSGAGHAGLLLEVVDLMEYPTVVAGTFAAEKL